MAAPCHRPETCCLSEMGVWSDDWSAWVRCPHSLLPVSFGTWWEGALPAAGVGARGDASPWAGVEEAAKAFSPRDDDDGEALHLVTRRLTFLQRRPFAREYIFSDDLEAGGPVSMGVHIDPF